MGLHGVANPHRASFLGGIATNGENKIHLCRIRAGKFIPTFAAEMRSLIAFGLQKFQNGPIWNALGLVTSAKRIEPPAPVLAVMASAKIKRAGIARAEKNNVFHVKTSVQHREYRVTVTVK